MLLQLGLQSKAGGGTGWEKSPKARLMVLCSTHTPRELNTLPLKQILYRLTQSTNGTARIPLCPHLSLTANRENSTKMNQFLGSEASEPSKSFV